MLRLLPSPTLTLQRVSRAFYSSKPPSSSSDGKTPFVVPRPATLVSAGSTRGPLGSREAASENSYFDRRDRELLASLAKKMKAMETTLSSAGIAAKGNPVELPAWLESWEYEGKEASAPYEHAHEHDLDGVIANKKAASNAGAEKSGGTNPILPSAHGSGAFGTREAASEDRYVYEHDKERISKLKK